MTDFGVYARAAWAVRVGADLYSITDSNQWHYIYPPTFAILMTPLADPPGASNGSNYLPFAVGVALWYAISVAILVIVVDRLANCVEDILPSRPGESLSDSMSKARSFLLRFGSLAICLPHIGNTLARGQVGFLWLGLLAGFLIATVRRHSLKAGWFLAGAICLKVIPAYLLLVPIWRRDRRSIAGSALGLAVGLIALPVVTLGPLHTVETYRSFVNRVLAPGLGGGDDPTLAAELTDITSTRSQAPLCIAHHWTHWDKSRYERPGQPDGFARCVHWIFAATITIAALAFDRGSNANKATRDFHLVANLMLAMILISPVCHMHYFLLTLPIVMLTIAKDRNLTGRLTFTTTTATALAFFVLASIATLMPEAQRLQDSGILPLATLCLMVRTAWLVRRA